MIEQKLRQFLEYKHRKPAVIIGTILTGLVVVLPVVDEYSAAAARTAAARTAVSDAEIKIGKLPMYERAHRKRLEESNKLAALAVNEKAANDLKNQLLEAVRGTGCTMRHNKLGDPTRRAWMVGDDPTRGTHVAGQGEETPFELETRGLGLIISGRMANLLKFLDVVFQTPKLIHVEGVSLKQSDEDAEEVVLELTFKLFDLRRKTTEEKS